VASLYPADGQEQVSERRPSPNAAAAECRALSGNSELVGGRRNGSSAVGARSR